MMVTTLVLLTGVYPAKKQVSQFSEDVKSNCEISIGLPVSKTKNIAKPLTLLH